MISELEGTQEEEAIFEPSFSWLLRQSELHTTSKVIDSKEQMEEKLLL
jgi:hypothetical protein